MAEDKCASAELRTACSYRNQGMLSATAFTVNPQTDRDYAWVTVNIRQSGRITMTAYGFDDQVDAINLRRWLTTF